MLDSTYQLLKLTSTPMPLPPRASFPWQAGGPEGRGTGWPHSGEGPRLGQWTSPEVQI